MAFLEERLEDAVMRGTRGGPRGRRVKTYVQNGRLRQSFEASRPLHVYDISFGIRTLEDFEAIRAMFYVVMFTPYEGFRVRDWNDYELTQANSELTLISGSNYQICRKYTIGSASFLREIYKLDGAPTIYRTRSAVVSTATATVDEDTGVAAITGHVSGDTYTAEGRFDVPVTFMDDAMDQIGLDGNVEQILQELPSIKLEEIIL